MKKIRFAILAVLLANCLFGQEVDGIRMDAHTAEYNFQSVAKSMKTINRDEMEKYKAIGTLTNPEAYLILDFNGKTGTLSIAVRDGETFKVYGLVSEKRYVGDTLNPNAKGGKIKLFDIVRRPQLKIGDPKRIGLDQFKSEELMLGFSYQLVGCPYCNQSQATITNGYVIFDFDRLQLLKLITFDTTTLASQLKDLENFGKSEIAFRKNYIRIGKSKYRYEDDKLIKK